MALNVDVEGRTYPSYSYEVTAEEIRRYSHATNDPNEHYLREVDPVASPIFPVVPAFRAMMAVAMDPDLGADLRYGVHASQEHALRSTIRAGDLLTVTGHLAAVRPRGAGGSFQVVITETRGSEEVARLTSTMFVRDPGRTRSQGGGEGASGDELSYGSDETLVQTAVAAVDLDQPLRYAEASGDDNPIHVDESAARAVGLPGVILQGMCSMAMAVRGAVNGLAGGDPEGVALVRVNFKRPVLPGDEVVTRYWRTSTDQPSEGYRFAAEVSGRGIVLDRGYIELRPGSH